MNNALRNGGKASASLLRPGIEVVALLMIAGQIGANPAGPGPIDAAAETTMDTARRIYRQGILPSGKMIDGVVQGDVALRGTQLVCSNCHGRSGLGASEGAIYTPPIAGPWLFQPKEIRRRELYSNKTHRPAYTDATLKRAIRDGIDPNGRELSAMMPRYALGDDEVDMLTDYLKTLSGTQSPGVTESSIHFATVVTDGVAPTKSDAVVEVLEKFVALKNAGTRNEKGRAAHAPIHKAWRYEAYRDWKLHVWQLSGKPETWAAQLQQHYDSQPVFALLSGIGAETWQPVHEFCEQRELPCLFPNTELPVIAAADYYTVYFSAGMTLAAQTAAQHLVAADAKAVQRVLQVFRDEPDAMRAADAFRAALAAHNRAAPIDLLVGAGEALTAKSWQTLIDGVEPTILVVWLGDADIASINALAGARAVPDRIYLASALFASDPGMLVDGIRDKVLLLYPNDLPSDSTGRLERNNSWLKRNGIEPRHDRLQANAQFAAMLLSQAMKHIGSNFHRDYLLERIEHTVDGMSTLASYPHLSLAKNQRFAAKGCYVVRLVGQAGGDIAMVGEWIVP